MRTNFIHYILFIIISCICSACNETKVTPRTSQEKKTVEIAILMPLIGHDSILGKQYNELIKLGIQDGLQGSDINIISYDCSDTNNTLASINKIISRKTQIILGPIYSDTASKIANATKTNDIIMLTMSNNPVLADNKLFVFGHAPLKQLDYIINYFLKNNAKDFITLLPIGQNSQTIAKIIENMAITHNATLSATAFYDIIPESINKAVKSISDKVDNLNEVEELNAKPVIYLSDDQKNLSLILNNITQYDLDKKANIIGDNRIDIDANPNINITFTGSLNITSTGIEQKVKALGLGIDHISFMHALAYDLGKMTATYIGNQFTQDMFLYKLNNLEYPGISGNIRFIDNIAQREYDIIKRENGIYNTISQK